MKRIIGLLLFLITIHEGYAQFSFEIQITEYSDYFYPADAIETASGNFIIAANRDSAMQTPYYPFLIKVNNQGNIISTNNIHPPDSGAFIRDILTINDSVYFGLGSIFNDTSNYSDIWIFQFNENLEILWEKQYYLTYGYHYIIGNSILDYDNNIVITGYMLNISIDPPSKHVFLIKFSLNGDTLLTKHIYTAEPSVDRDIILKPDSSGYINNTYTGIFITDIFFNVDTFITVHPLTVYNFYSGYTNLEGLNNKIIFSAYLTIFGNDNEDMGISIVDESFNSVYSNQFGKPDTTDYPAKRISLDYYYPNDIFYCGTSNIILGENPFLPISPSWYIINKLDSTLNLQWQKFYGGEAAYTLHNVAATSDGGCILLGGILTGRKETDLVVKDVIIYPNPGSDMLYIRNGIPGRMLNFEMSDGSGKLALLRENIGMYDEIHVSSLAKGTYFFVLKNKDKVVESGTWVKAR
ncbi:MAG: T9SS type A sorting domain-containing protein [Bacteroidia bacterium]|nr:T9SS type A sorting domain-containing protein [Bacteroidia bacterium]